MWDIRGEAELSFVCQYFAATPRKSNRRGATPVACVEADDSSTGLRQRIAAPKLAPEPSCLGTGLNIPFILRPLVGRDSP